jgi:tRNA(fMet)-specific endonuclease VapC
MPRFMLDTDTCSYIVKRSSTILLKRLQSIAVRDVCISVIKKAELLYGVEISPRRRQDEAAVQLFLRHVEVMDFPDESATDYAKIRADLKNRGEMIGANDLLLAAHARCLDLILVTNNTREFRRVRGLSIENWTLPLA